MSFRPASASACFTAAATPSTTGTPNFLRQLLREIGHARAAQHDRLRALVERARNLGFQFLLGARAGLFEIEHRDVAGGDLCPLGKAIAAHQLFQRHDRARQRGDDGDAFCDLPRGHQRRLANADHREARRRCVRRRARCRRNRR